MFYGTREKHGTEEIVESIIFGKMNYKYALLSNAEQIPLIDNVCIISCLKYALLNFPLLYSKFTLFPLA